MKKWNSLAAMFCYRELGSGVELFNLPAHLRGCSTHTLILTKLGELALCSLGVDYDDL